jgi:type I restriction enzyme S subunit
MNSFDLPGSWRKRKLPEIANMKNGGTPPKVNKRFWYGGDIPFVTAADLTDLYVDRGRTFLTEEGLCSGKTVICEKDDLLVGTRTRVGNCSIAKKRIGASQDITRIRFKVPVLPEFYYWFFRTISEGVAFYSQGTSIQGITRDLLNSIEIPFPPLDEQRRIVARIEELTRRAEEATQLRQASIKDVQICYRAAISQIFNNADESCLHKLGKKVAIIGGNSIPETAPRPRVEDDRIGLMKVSDMNSKGNELYIRQCHLETDCTTAKNLRLRVLPVGSIVFPKRGGAIATNKKRMLTIPAALDPNLMGVYPLAGSKLKNSYLYWWFESLDLALLQEDGGIPQVNKKHIEPLMIPIPDETEQDVIVKKLNRIQNHHNQLISLQREIEAAMAMFQPALLAKAFRGEL